jgi:hypothetical protein
MKKRAGKEEVTGVSLSDPTPSELRGRQSVRATFKLSEKAIDAVSIISILLGIKQKSLFDHLLEDMESLELLAQEIQSQGFDLPHRVQKTYVVSRKTLLCLERVSENFHTPRDALVEYSIQRLLPMIANERETHQRRKELLKEWGEYLRQGERILRSSKESLGEDDPVHGRFEAVMKQLSIAHNDIASFVEKGKIIEDF